MSDPAERQKPALSGADQIRQSAAKPGQPTKVGVVGPRLIAAVRTGLGGYSAARLVGLHHKTYYNWLDRGRLDFEAEIKVEEETGQRPESSPYSRFYQDICHAEAEVEQHAVAIWRQAMPTDWRAAEAFLKRRFPDNWGGEKLEVTGKDGGPVLFTINLTSGQEEAI